MLKRVISLVLCFVMLLSAVLVTVFADDSDPAEVIPLEVEGVPNEPEVPAPEAIAVTQADQISEIAVGEKLQLSCNILSEGAQAEISWHSSDEKVAVTDETGLVTGVAEGNVTIFAKCGNIYGSFALTVKATEGPETEPTEPETKPTEPEESAYLILTQEQNLTELEVGSSLTLSAAVYPESAEAGDLIWSSSNEEIAGVENGVVTGYTAGQVTITSTLGQLEDSYTLTVIYPKIVAEYNPDGSNATARDSEGEIPMLRATASSYYYRSDKKYGTLYSQAIDAELSIPTYTKLIINFASTSPNNTGFYLYKNNPWKMQQPDSNLRHYYSGNYEYAREQIFYVPAGEYTLRIYPDFKLDAVSSFWVQITCYNESHNCSYSVETKKPTCTRGGYETWECKLCGKRFTTNQTDALGHNEVPEARVEPTCTKLGKTSGTKCSRCGIAMQKQQDIPMLPHKPVDAPDVLPTCTVDGITDVVKCKDCGQVLSSTPIPNLGGHDFALYDYRICSVCGEVDSSIVLQYGDAGENIKWFHEKGDVLRFAGTGKMYEYDGAVPWGRKAKIYIGEGITTICDNAFHSNTYLSYVSLPRTLKTIGDHAFEFTSLTDIRIPDGVRYIGERAFANSNLTDITILGNVKAIGPSAFSSCSDLLNLTLEEGIKEIGTEAFYKNSRLQSISIPDSVISIGKKCFASATHADRISIGAGLREIPESAFHRCNRVTGISFSQAGNLKSIGDYAFYCCEKITGIILPDGLETIGESAFEGASLLGVSVPATLKSVGMLALQGGKITVLTYGGTPSQWYSIHIAGGNTALTVPKPSFGNSGFINNTKWNVYERTLIITGSGETLGL